MFTLEKFEGFQMIVTEKEREKGRANFQFIGEFIIESPEGLKLTYSPRNIDKMIFDIQTQQILNQNDYVLFEGATGVQRYTFQQLLENETINALIYNAIDEYRKIVGIMDSFNHNYSVDSKQPIGEGQDIDFDLHTKEMAIARLEKEIDFALDERNEEYFNQLVKELKMLKERNDS